MVNIPETTKKPRPGDCRPPPKKRFTPCLALWQEAIYKRMAEIGVEKSDFIDLREGLRREIKDDKDCWFLAADHFLLQKGLDPEYDTRGLEESVKDKRVDPSELVGGKFEPVASTSSSSAAEDIEIYRWVRRHIGDAKIQSAEDCPSPDHFSTLEWARGDKDTFFPKMLDLAKALLLKTVEANKGVAMRDDSRSQCELIEKVRAGYMDDRG